jgi:acyl-CoA reductase-like NAD-dependent aldehyde dehydrogenase
MVAGILRTDTNSLQGFFYEPTVITGVTSDMEIVQQEVFGPVVAAYSFKVSSLSSLFDVAELDQGNDVGNTALWYL